MADERSRSRESIGQLITSIARLWRRTANERLDRYGLSHAVAMPLLALWQLGGEARQGAVAEQAGLEGPSLVRLIDLLVAEGLVTRREDASDRRAKILTLTDEGMVRMKSINMVLAELRHELVSLIGDEELETTSSVLRQIQAELPTVQGVLTAAVEALSGEKTLVQGAGRTDAGVHARGQVAHVDLAKDWDTDTVRDALNAHLRPHPVAILAAERAADDFNARTSAIKRHYLYRIINRRADLTLDAGYAWRVPRPLDAAAMHAAAQRLVGKHDFTTFRSTECQAKSPLKTLDRLDVERDGDDIVVLASARSFLHSQVRSMVGSLAMAGEGKWSADDLARVLAARDRTACGQVAPPDGLYLMQVDY